MILTRKKFKELQKKFDAKLQTTLLVKRDRLIDRIEQFKNTVRKDELTKKEFESFIKSVEILIGQELSQKGNTRDIKAVYYFSGKAKDWKKIGQAD